MSHGSRLTGVRGTSWARLLIFVSYCFWLFVIPSAICSTNPETLLCARPCAGLSGRGLSLGPWTSGLAHPPLGAASCMWDVYRHCGPLPAQCQ